MKTQPPSPIRIVTLGCSKNVVDSEVLAGQLRASKVESVHDEHREASDTVVINTCGFIDKAKEESVQTILDYVERKRRGDIRRVYVSGCLSQRYGEELAAEIPEVDGFFGTGDLSGLVETLGAEYREELLGERETSTDSHYAYLKVAEGCNRGCGFCAIPLMRGKHVSRDLDFLVDEARYLVGRGVRELMLIAQDLTYYGLDLYGERRLKELLERLADIEGLDWIRLHYAYPSGFPVDILPVIRGRDNICNYLDIPIQHASSRMLKIMRRAITKKRTEDLLTRIREEVPGIALRTTVLVGHPGETEEDHEELLQFLERMRLDRVGGFIYSHEEATHSFTMPDEVPPDIKQRRLNEVMALQQSISLSLNEARVGQTLKVLVDREGVAEDGEDGYIARTEYDSPEVDNQVLLQGEGLRTGEFYRARITGALEYDLLAEVEA